MQIFTLRVWRNVFSRKWVRTNESNQPRLALHWLREQCNCHELTEYRDLTQKAVRVHSPPLLSLSGCKFESLCHFFLPLCFYLYR